MRKDDDTIYAHKLAVMQMHIDKLKQERDSLKKENDATKPLLAYYKLTNTQLEAIIKEAREYINKNMAKLGCEIRLDYKPHLLGQEILSILDKKEQ